MQIKIVKKPKRHMVSVDSITWEKIRLEAFRKRNTVIGIIRKAVAVYIKNATPRT